MDVAAVDHRGRRGKSEPGAASESIMSRMSWMRCACFVVSVGVLVATGVLPGCVWVGIPGPSSVLEGTWLVEQEEGASLAQTFWTFNAQGQLTEIVFASDNTTVTQLATGSTSTVQDSQVTVQWSMFGIGWNFTGTLNDEQNVINGSLTSTVTIYTTRIDHDEGPATLTKQ
jgi:hypothetical protein